MRFLPILEEKSVRRDKVTCQTCSKTSDSYSGHLTYPTTTRVCLKNTLFLISKVVVRFLAEKGGFQGGGINVVIP